MRCSCDDQQEWTRGDDTNAFGRHCVQVNRPSGIGDEVVITKAIFTCGPFKDTKLNPEFPYYVDFTSEQTSQLKPTNKAQLIVFDEDGFQATCEGYVTIKTKSRM